MNATAQTSMKQSALQARGVNCGSESLPDFVREHFVNLAYANRVGWVYVASAIDCDGATVMKVGFSLNPEKRVNELNNATPFRQSKLIASVPGRMIDEMAFHELMRPHRLNQIHKEWYLPCYRIEALAAHMMETGALPDEVIRFGHALALELVTKRVRKAARHKLGGFLIKKRAERAGNKAQIGKQAPRLPMHTPLPGNRSQRHD